MTQDSSQNSADAASSEAVHDKGPLLGKQVSGSETYDPSLLFPVPRSNARQTLPEGVFEGYGEDIWHAYELSWLDDVGMPRMFVGILSIPAISPNIIESKSLKLYLNSLNNHSFETLEHAVSTIEGDLSGVAGEKVSLNVLDAGDRAFRGELLEANCLDDIPVIVPPEPHRSILDGREGDAVLCTHLLRSLCPVTAQPDWATLVVETKGRSPTDDSLLAYALSYRNHQEFHEQCVERIFTDIQEAVGPDYLSVHALYTRRGGLDISPWRCSEEKPAPQWRLARQ